MRKLRKVATLSAVSMAVLGRAQPPPSNQQPAQVQSQPVQPILFRPQEPPVQPILQPQQYPAAIPVATQPPPDVPNYLNPAYQEVPRYRRADQPQPQYPPEQPQQEGSGLNAPMKRRTAIKIIAVVGGVGIGSAVLGQLWSAGDIDPNAYKGKITALEKYNSKEEEIFYKDICHTNDVNLSGQVARLGIILLDKDKSYKCSDLGIESANSLRVLMSPDTYYRVDSWEKDASGLDIFNAAKLGRDMKVKKGSRSESGFWLDKVYYI